MSIHIIAEAGTNHNGCPELAERLVASAAEAGADSVKFQVIYPEGLYLPKLYEGGALTENVVYRKRQAGMLSDDAWRSLATRCRELGVPFSASVFDRRGINLLVELGAPYIKTASCDLNNSRLLIRAAETGKRLVISTGMASLGEIERAVADVTATGNRDVVLMHCVSQYPCPTEQMNLAFIQVLRSAFGLPVGLSDHTESSIAAAAAIAMGATWIEKHLTLDRSSEGFDHAYAMEPPAFAQYVKDVRAVAIACERQPVKVGPGETQVKQRARRSVYAARDLKPGETLTEADLLVVRPEGPLRPNDLELVLGRPLQRAVRQFEPMTLESVARR